MAKDVQRHEGEGKVQTAVFDEVITDPNHPDAVSIPPEADASGLDPLSVHEEPTPEEVFSGERDPAESSSVVEESSDPASDESPDSDE